MADDFEVSAVIVCDDIRQEISNKFILVGAYSGSMVINAIPAVIPLGVFIIVQPHLLRYNKVFLTIKGPNGAEIKSGEGPANFTDLRFAGSVAFKFQTALIAAEGVYEFYLSMDSEPRLVLSFPVIKRENIVTQTH
jgi:hypothetical protein